MTSGDYGQIGSQLSPRAWLLRLVVRRAIADRGLLLPALLTCVLATTVMAAGPIFASAVATAGVRSVLRDAAPTAANVRVTSPAGDEPLEEVEHRAHRAITAATTPPGATVQRQLWSPTFALPGRDELVEFAWLDAGHATAVTGGRWPSGTGGTAVPDPVADALGLHVGDTLQVADASTGAPATVDVAATFRVTDPDAVQWWGAAPAAGADWVRGGFTIYGPLLVDRPTLVDELGVDEIVSTAALAAGRLDASTIDELRRRVAGLARTAGDGLTVDTDLPELLGASAQRLLASRAVALAVVLQLFCLAVYALLLTARLVVAERDVEVALLRARGATPGQLAGVAVAEALLIVLPAVAAGPPLARIAVGFLDERGALADAGLTLEPSVTGWSVAVAVLAGVVALGALALQALPATRDVLSTRRQAGRQRRVGAVQRTGVDVALLVVAGAGYWQLRQAGGPVTAGIQGRLGVDPMLIAAPALCLLAGAVLTLRAVPLLARVAERLAVAGRSLLPPLAAWQVARRPRSYARATLLPVLALALGLYAVSYGRTRDAAQAAAARAQVGADVRVVPGGAGVAPEQLWGAYDRIAGVTAAVPAVTDVTQISREAGNAGILAVPAAAAQHLDVDDATRAALADLAPERPSVPGTSLPAARELAFRVTAEPGAGGSAGPPPRLGVLARDRFGVVHRVPAGDIPTNATAVNRVDLTGLAPPVALTGLEIAFDVDGVARRYPVVIEPATAAGRTSSPFDANWMAEVRPEDAGIFAAPPEVVVDDAGTTLQVDVAVARSGFDPSEAVVRVLAGAVPPGDPAGLVVTRQLAETLAVGRGDPVSLNVGPVTLPAQVDGIVPVLPALPDDADAGGAAIDLGALAAASLAQQRQPVVPTTWLLDVDGDTDGVVRRLRADPLASAEVFDRAAIAAAQRFDPVALGVIGSLALGFAAAAMLAALGFVVTAVAAVRQRLREFALLRAIGLSGRQLLSWVTLEQGVLLAGALAGGVALGAAMSWLILPYTVLDATGPQAATAQGVQIAWLDVAGLVAVLLAAVGLSVVAMARPLRRLGLGSTLRAGEDR